jgi:hypothetical protein
MDVFPAAKFITAICSMNCRSHERGAISNKKRPGGVRQGFSEVLHRITQEAMVQFLSTSSLLSPET